MKKNGFIYKLKNNKLLNICCKILKIFFTIFVICALVVVLIQKIFNNKDIGGYRVFSVASGSMENDYFIGDIIVVKKVSASDLKVGDDVTYLGNKNNLKGLIITHRIESIRKDDTNYFYTTKGISNKVEDPEISYSQIYGKVIYKTILFSFIGRLMSNVYSYYALFTIVGLYTSYQIVKIKFDED